MTIAIFPARKTQLEYAKRLKKHLKERHEASSCVLWYKDIWLNLLWLPNAIKTQPDLTGVIFDQKKTRQNSPSLLSGKRSASYSKYIVDIINARVQYAIYYYAFKKHNISHLVLWNGLKFRQRIAVQAASSLGISCYFIERGAFPGTTTLDPKGINFFNSVPRDCAFYQKNVFKKNLPDDYQPKVPETNKPYIFVPFQVNTDSQIILLSHWINNMMELVDLFIRAAKELGDTMPHIIFKPHPSCPQDYKTLITKCNSEEKFLYIDTKTPTNVLIANSAAVITINSSVGMEAILSGKAVGVLGKAFYNIPGICMSANNYHDLIQMLKEITSFKPDNKIVENFLSYLKTEHAVPGTWKSAEKLHLDAMTDRLLTLIRSSKVVD